MAVAELEWCARPGEQVAVAGAFDEHAPADGGASRLALDDHGVDQAIGRFGDADREGVEQDLDPGGGEQVVGGDLVGRDVVGLRLDLVREGRVRRVQRIHAVEPAEDVVGDAVHYLAVLAVDIGVQAAEGRQSRRRAGTAEKAVALDQERGRAAARRSGRGRDAGGPAAEHHHVEFAHDPGRPGRFVHL